ncbi:MAG TPA: hypothetical protein VK501_02220 [Baekduia sp.]|uniref:hypothetical protein n=1 Tax=Baekduia sp. TaxID=2600305 RepID=UPI002B617B7D|nr:hypothetical protein [Baekduia sp.]HMJ32705.1 hypothetical protein [Baekduia sp.]
MAAWEPLWMSPGAWEAIGDQVIGPAQATDAAQRASLELLRAAWQDARRENDRVAVFITPELAAVLADLLDRQPELAALLGTG